MKKPINHWSFEKCLEIALKYRTKTELETKHSGVSHAARKNNWYKEITAHMDSSKIRKWFYDDCKRVALNYKYKKDLLKSESGLCKAAIRNGWYDEITLHMKNQPSRIERLIYLIEFTNKVCYVGLTYNFEKRINSHLNNDLKKKSPVRKYMNINHVEPINIIKLTNYINVDDAILLEQHYIDKYKLLDYKLINSNKGGGIGATNKITYSECKIAANKYRNIPDFKNSLDVRYLRKIYSMGWLDLISKIQKMKWNYEKCVIEAKKYKSPIDFERNCVGAYVFSKKHGFYNDLKQYWENIRIKWSYDICIDIACKYNSYHQFIKENKAAYMYAIRNNMLSDLKNISYGRTT